MSVTSRLRAIVAAGVLLAIVSATTAKGGGVSDPAAHVETGTYLFSPDQSTLGQTGGIHQPPLTYSVQGQFQLIVDRDAKTASFTHVDANATRGNPPQRILDLNDVFNLTLLVGTTVDDKTISFTGKAPDHSDVRITVTLQEGLVRLVGRTTPPPGGMDFHTFSLDAVAQRKYSGGTGEPNDPYQIATAADLIALGETSADYDKHFILTADIDLDPNLPGRKVFDNAVIAPDTDPTKDWFQGTPFTGIFDGNGHTISHLTITGKDFLGVFGQLGTWNTGGEVKNLGLVDVNIVSSGSDVGGLVGYSEGEGTVTQCYSTGVVSGTGRYVGGLVGQNNGDEVTDCYSTGAVRGDRYVGGLVGDNSYGIVTQCYSKGAVSGVSAVGGLVGVNTADITTSYGTGAVNGDEDVGGLVGRVGSRIAAFDYATVTRCYSTGAVSGRDCVGGLAGWSSPFVSVTQCYSTGAVNGVFVGGLVGSGLALRVTASFWDIQTSGQVISAGGTGKTTAEMQMAKTFLDAGWDFVGETANGTEDIWWILEGKDYPRLWWEAAKK